MTIPRVDRIALPAALRDQARSFLCRGRRGPDQASESRAAKPRGNRRCGRLVCEPTSRSCEKRRSLTEDKGNEAALNLPSRSVGSEPRHFWWGECPAGSLHRMLSGLAPNLARPHRCDEVMKGLSWWKPLSLGVGSAVYCDPQALVAIVGSVAAALPALKSSE